MKITDYFTEAIATIESHRRRVKKAENRAEMTTLALFEDIREKRDWKRLLDFPPELLCSKQASELLGAIMAHVIHEGHRDLFKSLLDQIKRRDNVVKPMLVKLVDLEVNWSRVGEFLSGERFEYVNAVLKADNVKLLCNYRELRDSHIGLYIGAGKYNAKNCVDFLGYADNRERSYLQGAIEAQNLECVRWLLSKSEATRNQLVNDYLLTFSFDAAEVDFAAKIVTSGLVTPTSEEWRVMEEQNKRLYVKLQNDV